VDTQFIYPRFRHWATHHPRPLQPRRPRWRPRARLIRSRLRAGFRLPNPGAAAIKAANPRSPRALRGLILAAGSEILSVPLCASNPMTWRRG
jgi:hypothetical protein